MTSAPRVGRGTTFTHATMLDPDWKPGPGQRYADAPKAECVVTSVRGSTVFFRYASDAGGRSTFRCDLADLATPPAGVTP